MQKKHVCLHLYTQVGYEDGSYYWGVVPYLTISYPDLAIFRNSNLVRVGAGSRFWENLFCISEQYPNETNGVTSVMLSAVIKRQYSSVHCLPVFD